MQRHARTKAHRSAVKAYIQRRSPKLEHIGAFPLEDFQAVWDRLRGHPPKRTISKRKRFTIEWCIYEALREQERSCLARADTIAVAMDD